MALAVNLGLLLLLMTLGIIPTPGTRQASEQLVVDLIPEGRQASKAPATQAEPRPQRSTHVQTRKPQPKTPAIVLPSKPTIAPEPAPTLIAMSSAELAAADIASLPQAKSGSAGDSPAVGQGPHGEVLYAAEWAREPTNAELGGYLPRNAPDGWGLIACKTVPNNRVEDCVELGNEPRSSHLASAARQAAWQFRVRPPRKNGRAMIGEWVRIRIEYETIRAN
ncbi:MAG: hypothetical protein ABIO80_01350 [Sphingomicrobium sp.]